MTTRRPAVERRLRTALDARARLITAHDLSPARPPVGRAWGTRRIRRTASLVVAAAAATAVLCFLLLPGSPGRSRPEPPAHHPRVSDTPTPAPAPTSTPGDSTRPRPSPSKPAPGLPR
ncbi:hypothetical protein [Streptomyces sp. NBRC 110028]|uniref:hypothetical protein n=1 Tax=Streptomyces sp. NBRC 110028 TaxID=1621260 RepID=UPI0006E28D61|nr:hypothetical protein [Streptomyces sp. NBRC 110028]